MCEIGRNIDTDVSNHELNLISKIVKSKNDSDRCINVYLDGMRISDSYQRTGIELKLNEGK